MNHGKSATHGAVADLLSLSAVDDAPRLGMALRALGYNHAHVVAAHELRAVAGSPLTRPVGDPDGYAEALRSLVCAIRPWLTETAVEPRDAFLWHVAFGDDVPEVAREWLRLSPLGWLAHAAGVSPAECAERVPAVAVLWSRVALGRTPVAARVMRVIPVLTDPVLLGLPIEIPSHPAW